MFKSATQNLVHECLELRQSHLGQLIKCFDLHKQRLAGHFQRAACQIEYFSCCLLLVVNQQSVIQCHRQLQYSSVY